MRSIRGTKSLAAILAATALAVLPVAAAQAQTPTPAAPQSTIKPSDISEKQLDASAIAVKNVSAIKTNFDQKMAQAPSTEKGRLADEAADAMTKAVTDQGLSVDEYVAIIEVAQSDPVVRDKLIQRMR